MTRSILWSILNFFNSFTSSTSSFDIAMCVTSSWMRADWVTYGWLGHTTRHIFITHTSLYQWSNLTHWSLVVIWRGLRAHLYMDIWQQWWAISNIGIITLSFIYCAVYMVMSIDTHTIRLSIKSFFLLNFFFSSLIRLIKYTHTLFLTRKRTTFSFFHFLIFCLASFLHSFLDTSVCFHLSLNNFSPFYPHILISL